MRRHRAFRLAALALLFTLTHCAAVHLIRTAAKDRPAAHTAAAAGTFNDASRLNETPVQAVIDVSPDDDVAVAQVRSAFERARRTSTRVSVAGYRHSMGGQTITTNGIVLNMLPHNRMELRGDVLHVQSGARWTDVIQFLEGHGRSVAVMQSDSPFSVGGSLSVNCHGWQHLHEPIASTVISMTVMTPAGEKVRSSRTEHVDLFRHVLGGYGLFGVILDADLQTVPNERYREHQTICDIRSYERIFDETVRENSGVGMAYGRISVAPETFLREAILTAFHRETAPVPKLGPIHVSRLERLLFRGSVGSDYGKNLRWRLEKLRARLSRGRTYSRNQVLHQTIDVYVERGAVSTDILHEYFIPRGKLSAFIERIRPMLERADVDLLNITVRDVKKDELTALPYARDDVFAVVMFFSQRRTAEGEEAMRDVTRDLIDTALDLGGTYYLPYRLHATDEQFARAYPEAQAFFAMKQQLDRDGILSNLWYERYRTGR